MLLNIVIFILILAFLVLIHEFGHFFAAKKSGVLVEEFGFGFPPRVWGKKIGETIYSINLLPIGGFVKVYGEMYHEEDTAGLNKRAFVSQHPLKKTIILLAGIFMNTMLAVAIYYILLAGAGFRSEPLPLLHDYTFRFGTQVDHVVVGRVVPDSPAAEAGITTGDLVEQVTVTGETPSNITSAQSMIALISKAGEKKVMIRLQNISDGTEKEVTITPYYDEELKRPLIGVGLTNAAVIEYTKPSEKLFSGFLHSYNIVAYSIDTMKLFVGASYQQKSIEPVAETVAGPVGIFGLVQEILESSGKKVFTNLAQLIALLSLSLALINVLPFPALDGGRMIFVLYEWIARKRPNAMVEQYVNMAGFVILILFAILVSINDVSKLLK